MNRFLIGFCKLLAVVGLFVLVAVLIFSPRWAARPEEVAVEDHNIGAGSEQAKLRWDQMDSHHARAFRIEGTMAHTIFVFSVLGNFVLDTHCALASLSVNTL